MAKKISNESFIDKDFLQPAIESVKEFIKQIGLLKKTMSEVGQESKKTIEGLDPTTKISDVKKLNHELEKLLVTEQKLEQATQQEKKAKETLSATEKQRLRILEALKNSTTDQALELAKLKIQLSEANKEMKQSAKDSLKLTTEYEKLVRATNEAKNKAKELGATLGTESKEFKKAAAEADALNTKLVNIDTSFGDFGRKVGNYSSAFDGLKQGFGGFLELVTPAGLALAGVTIAIEGITALSESIAETNKNLKETGNLTGLVGQELENYTAKLQTTSKVFDKDYKEILRTTNVLQKEFGISGQEAIDLINQGFINGLDINDDYLQQLEEYSTQFKSVGLSAKDLNNIIGLQAKEGIFDDKLVDTVKEGGLRLREFTKATSDALKPLGEFRNEQIKQKIESGNTFEAIQLVSKALKDVNLTASQSQTIIADVFGGAGEDAGLRAIQLLADVDSKQKSINENLTQQQKKQLALLEVEERINLSTVKLATAFGSTGTTVQLLGKELKALGIELILDGFNELKEFINDISSGFEELGGSLSELKQELGFTGEGALDFFKKFNPISLAIERVKIGIKAVTFVLNLLVQAWTQAIQTSKEIYNSLENGVTAIIEYAKSFEVVRTVLEKINAVFGQTKTSISDIPKFLNGLSEAFSETFIQINDRARKTFKNVGDLIKGVLTFDPKLIQQSLSSQLSNFEGAGVKIAEAFNRGFNQVDIKIDEKKVVAIDEKKVVAEAEKTKKQTVTDVIKTPEKDKKAKKDTTKDDEEKRIEEEKRKKLELLEEERQEIEVLLKKSLLDKEITEQDFRELSLQNELEYLEKKKKLLEQYNQSTLSEEEKKTDLLLNEQKRLQSEQEKAQKEKEKIDEDKKKTEIDAREKLIENSENFITKQIEKANEKRLSKIDSQIEAITERQESLRTLAENGNEEAVKSLADSQKREAELRREKEKELRRQKLIEIGTAAFSVLASKSKQDPNTALSETFKEVLSLSGFINSLPQFFTGTENIGESMGKPHLNTNKDAYLALVGSSLARLDGGERVMSSKENKLIGDYTNAELTMLAVESRKPKFSTINSMNTKNIELLLMRNNEILKKLPSMMPTNMDTFDEKIGVLTSVAKYSNKIERTHKRLFIPKRKMN